MLNERGVEPFRQLFRAVFRTRFERCFKRSKSLVHMFFGRNSEGYFKSNIGCCIERQLGDVSGTISALDGKTSRRCLWYHHGTIWRVDSARAPAPLQGLSQVPSWHCLDRAIRRIFRVLYQVLYRALYQARCVLANPLHAARRAMEAACRCPEGLRSFSKYTKSCLQLL